MALLRKRYQRLDSVKYVGNDSICGIRMVCRDKFPSVVEVIGGYGWKSHPVKCRAALFSSRRTDFFRRELALPCRS